MNLDRRKYLASIGLVASGIAGCTTSGSNQMIVQCPICDRAEEFEYEVAGRAWLYGHIEVEHSEKVPEFEGTE